VFGTTTQVCKLTAETGSSVRHASKASNSPAIEQALCRTQHTAIKLGRHDPAQKADHVLPSSGPRSLIFFPPLRSTAKMGSLMAGQEFQHILRLLNTNVDGKHKVMFAMTAIRGIGRRFSNVVCKKAEVDMKKRAGACVSVMAGGGGGGCRSGKGGTGSVVGMAAGG